MDTKRVFVPDNNRFILQKLSPSPIAEKLPPKVYRACFDPQTGTIFVEHLYDKFVLPEKIYGSIHHQRVKRVLEHHKTTKNSLGVLLMGLKGTGKTLLSFLICNKLLEKGHPVIYFDTPIPAFVARHLIEFIDDGVFLLDEFGKLFKAFASEGDGHGVDAQSQLLTAFSDRNLSRRMILVTDNNESNLLYELRDRPGRFHYRFMYARLPNSAIEERVDADITDPEQALMLKYYGFYQEISMDCLDAAVGLMKEVNDVDTWLEQISWINVPVMRFFRLFCSPNINYANKRQPFNRSGETEPEYPIYSCQVTMTTATSGQVSLLKLTMDDNGKQVGAEILDTVSWHYNDTLIIGDKYITDKQWIRMDRPSRVVAGRVENIMLFPDFPLVTCTIYTQLTTERLHYPLTLDCPMGMMLNDNGEPAKGGQMPSSRFLETHF